MTAVRRNVLAAAGARDGFIRGVRLLKREFLGPTTADLGVSGPAQRVSTYDLFVVWHHRAMTTFTPPTQAFRNAAHMGPVFLPWHRFMLILLELQLQRVLDDSDFGLPYWDWAADGDRPAAQQASSPVWGDACMGGQGDPVATGPFAFDAADPGSWRVRLEAGASDRLRPADRGLRREFGSPGGDPPVPTLPTTADVAAALDQSRYDVAPWSLSSASGLRNRVEGWRPASTAPGLHNRVHVWVNGDMFVSTSPNDPVFYLNHCNVDRIWAAWQERPGATYLPDQSAGASLLGHRIDDAMHSLLTAPVTPRQMLDVSDFYTYDSLDVS